MADKGASYQAMQYSTQVQPVDFGQIALGFAKVSEDKRLESERKQKERESFQVEMTKLYEDEIVTPFDNTGIENLDIVSSKLKDGIVAHSEIFNKMFAEGTISQPQLASRMNKLKAQSAKYSAFIKQLGDYANKVKDLGSDASESTREILRRMDLLVKNAVPVVDSDGNIKFLSKDGEQTVATPFSDLDKIMDFRQQVNEESIVDKMITSEGELSKIYDKDQGAVKKTFLEDGGLNDAQKTLIGNYINTLDDTDLYDIATRAHRGGYDISMQINPGKLLQIDNREEVVKGVQNYMENLAIGKYQMKESIDKPAYDKLMSDLGVKQAQLDKINKETQNYVLNEIPATKEKGKLDQYVFLSDKRPNVISMTGYSVGIMNQLDKVDLNTAVIADYSTDRQGNHYATVAYTEQEPGGNLLDKPITVTKTKRIIILEPEVIGRVRSQLGLRTTPEDIAGKKKKETGTGAKYNR